MATVTVSKPDLFPNGTALSAYPERAVNRHGPNVDITAPAAATATVSAGSAALTGLVDGTSYVIVGTVSGKVQFLSVRTPEVNTGLAALLGATTNPNGTPMPSWRKRRRALGLV
jgi:hypothetical protein